jgi:hypothetical protein
LEVAVVAAVARVAGEEVEEVALEVVAEEEAGVAKGWAVREVVRATRRVSAVVADSDEASLVEDWAVVAEVEVVKATVVSAAVWVVAEKD